MASKTNIFTLMLLTACLGTTAVNAGSAGQPAMESLQLQQSEKGRVLADRKGAGKPKEGQSADEEECS